MRMQLLLLAITLLTSCQFDHKSDPKSSSNAAYDTVSSNSEIHIDNALTFLNEYVQNCNKLGNAVGRVKWVNSNRLATNHFKVALKKMIDEANKADPEMGMDADPILDAQDFPDKGFELDSYNNKTNYLIAKGKDWPDFKITVKMVKVNGHWLVDGCGIVNIPEGKRAKR
jgi:hypothetical protein